MKDNKRYNSLILLCYAGITICAVAIIALICSLIINGIKNLGYVKIIALLCCVVIIVFLAVAIVRLGVAKEKQKYRELNTVDPKDIIETDAMFKNGGLVNINVWNNRTELITYCRRQRSDGVYEPCKEQYLNGLETAAIRWIIECEPQNDSSVRAAILAYIAREKKKDAEARHKNVEIAASLSELNFTKLEVLTPKKGDVKILICGEINTLAKKQFAVGFCNMRLIAVGEEGEFEKLK